MALVCVTLVGVSIYTMNNYNNSKTKTNVESTVDDKTNTTETELMIQIALIIQ